MHMSHMVIYRGADGKPGYHQTDEITDAVAFVERLRNDQAVEHARIFRLEEVHFVFRPYFRVELTSGEGTGAVSGAGRQQVEASGPPAEGDVAESAPEAAPTGSSFGASQESAGDDAVGARRGLFGR
jgi:hypothetical protein